MEEMGILSQMLNNLDVTYILVCNIMTYLIIQGI